MAWQELEGAKMAPYPELATHISSTKTITDENASTCNLIKTTSKRKIVTSNQDSPGKIVLPTPALV
jgi:hypothetical protein